MTFSLVLPCYNEEQAIERVVREAFAWIQEQGIDGEVIAVNDGSVDGTRGILENLRASFPRLAIVHHPRNRGMGAALRSGCDAAQGDIVGCMDSDGQFRIREFLPFFALLTRTDIVAGIRVRRADHAGRQINSYLYNLCIRFVFRLRERDIDCGMKLFRRSVWSAIRPVYGMGAFFYAELFVRAHRHHLRVCQLGVEHYPRLSGKPTGAHPFVILRAGIDFFRFLTGRFVA